MGYIYCIIDNDIFILDISETVVPLNLHREVYICTCYALHPLPIMASSAFGFTVDTGAVLSLQ